MKNLVHIILFVMLMSLPVFSLDKSGFDLTEQQGLLKSGGGNSIANYGNCEIQKTKTGISLISGGYYTIGTNTGQSVTEFDNNCGITFGHPYAMTSYPLIGIDGQWGRFDEIHTNISELIPGINGDSLYIQFEQNGVKVKFVLVTSSTGESVKLLLKLLNLDILNHSCGGGIVFDPALGLHGDGVMTANGERLANETVISGTKLVGPLEIWERNSAAKGMGITLEFPNNPDRLTAANWPIIYQNSSSQTDISAEEPLYDLLLKMVWDEVILTPGQEQSFSATIALAEPDFSSPVFLRWNLPNALTLSNNVLYPKDVTTSVQMINVDKVNYSNARLLLDNPYEFYGDAEFVDLGIPATGSYSSLALHSREIYEDKVVKIKLICTQNGAVLDSLSRYVFIPQTPVSDVGLLVSIDSLVTTAYPDVNLVFSGEIEETGQKLLNLRKENIFLYENMTKIDRFTVTKDTTGGAGAVDIVFVLDVTGSMGGLINAVKNNIIEFADSLKERNVDYRLGMVTFLDEIENIYPFTENVTEFKGFVDAQYAHGGGDGPENSLDALMKTIEFNYRSNAKKIILWITDINYHISDSFTSLTIQQVVNALLANDLTVNVVGNEFYKQQYYDPFTIATGGNYYNINGNFRDVLMDLSRLKGQNKFLLSFKSNINNKLSTNQILLRVRYAGLGGEASIGYTPSGSNSAKSVLSCYPNPFNPEVKITIANPQGAAAKVGIYNLLGQKIRHYELQKNSPQQIIWNARDEQGMPVSSGLYMVLLEVQNKDGQVRRESHKIMYLK